MENNRPIIGITIGDPCGIGPEIVAKALTKKHIYENVRPVVIGDKTIMQREVKRLGLGLSLNPVDKPAQGLYKAGAIDLIDLDVMDPAVPYGTIAKQAGAASFAYIKKSVELALAGDIDGVATAPINKEAIHLAGVDYIGHTEMFAGLTDTPRVLTMFHVNKMRIFFLTRHMSLANAVKYVQYDNVLRTLLQADTAMKLLGFGSPRIAVAALNPHCGDNGLCGDEERTELAPAIRAAVEKGVNAFGPMPADSVFLLFESGQCDAVLSLYHDQGHIAAKVHDFLRTVSVTIGLPFVRTSVDHGTAMDIAGKGLAKSISMEESILVTSLYAPSLRTSL